MTSLWGASCFFGLRDISSGTSSTTIKANSNARNVFLEGELISSAPNPGPGASPSEAQPGRQRALKGGDSTRFDRRRKSLRRACGPGHRLSYAPAIGYKYPRASYLRTRQRLGEDGE